MRNYIFRGKPTENNTSYIKEEFVYGSLVIDSGKYYIVLSVNENIKRDDYEVYMIEVIPETVGQYIDLDDVNCKKIYEGDIVESNYYTKQVVYDKVHCNYGINKLESPEIIGNIHNKENL